jgi:hypothetical protein
MGVATPANCSGSKADMMPFPADASIQKSYVCLCKPSPHCVDTQQSPVDFRNCCRKRFANLLIVQKKPLTEQERERFVNIYTAQTFALA